MFLLEQNQFRNFISDIMATNYARASYQEVYDLGTRQGKVSVVGIHTPTGSLPRVMLNGFFGQFRKFRYTGCKVTLVPASTLPADPLQVSFEAGENTVDMRDMLNPILFHGTHGDTLAGALNIIFKDQAHTYSGESATDDEVTFTLDPNLEHTYYSALTDRTWKKYPVQSTAQLPSMRPLVWKTATNHPIVPTVHKQYGEAGSDGETIGRVFVPELTMTEYGTDDAYHNMHFMSTGVTSLGWLPTNQFFPVGGSSPNINTGTPTTLPKVFMGILMFPPSYLQELYFRMVITHYFEFRDFMGASFRGGVGSDAYNKWFTSGVSGQAVDAETGDPVDMSLDLSDSDARLTSAGVF